MTDNHTYGGPPSAPSAGGVAADGVAAPGALLIVAAVALIAADGRVLMQRRPPGARHGGLWEFPGGKVEPGEGLAAAAAREIDEELGIAIAPAALTPLTFAEAPGVMLALFVARAWTGTPECRAASALDWFAPECLGDLAMPPLDVPLARVLARARAGMEEVIAAPVVSARGGI